MDTDEHIQALVAALQGAGLTAAADDASGLTVPYVLVRDLGDRGNADEDPTDRTDGDVVLWLQIQSVSNDPGLARDQRDDTRELVKSLTVPGRSVHCERRQALSVLADRTVEPTRWHTSDRWAVWSTPST